jgi:hypothetical protein
MPRGSKPGERRGGRQPGTPNRKTALVNAAFDAATSNPDLSPLDFLLGVMRDPSISPDLRIKAAQAAAPYLHAKPGRSQATDPAVSAKQIEGVGEFIVEAGLARGLRDDMERLSSFDRRPLSAAEQEEKSELRGRIAEAARGISCPANYGRREAEQDRDRLQTIFAKRRSGASSGAKPLSEGEIAEEAQLAARVAAFDEGPEPRARGRILELAIVDFSRGLSDAETEELERLQKAYPPDPRPDPLTEAIAAFRRGELDWQIEKSKASSEG